ncbi:MAG TPA: ATP-binding cassette domain-containing protein, partial [Balneolales bacterium]|nr:ATP-binding cassette domain-containing protein [Balneolales bacterium]
MIRLEQLGKSFSTLRVLRDIDLEIKSGCVTAIVGPNGSGKSTTIKCILGLVKPDHGSVIVNNDRVNGDCEYRKDIGYMAQIAHFPENLKVRNVFDLVRDVRQAEPNSLDEELITR